MTTIRGSRRIAGPKQGKPPLQANVFQMLRSANSALLPMFPYVGPGDMVPAATIMWGGDNRNPKAFNHRNSIDEVAICFAAEGSRMRAGFVHVGARTHVVGNFFEDTADTSILMAIVVTQRQTEAGQPQDETLSFFCENCQTILLQHDYPAKADESEATTPGYHPPLETLTEGAICLEPYNASAEARTCPKCSKVNDPFPVSVWGWDHYYRNMQAAERGRQQFIAYGKGGDHAA